MFAVFTVEEKRRLQNPFYSSTLEPKACVRVKPGGGQGDWYKFLKLFPAVMPSRSEIL